MLNAYEEHFLYEEHLLDEHVYKGIAGGSDGKTKGRFSAANDARRSHYKDHARLIGDIQDMLTRMKNAEAGMRVPRAFIDRVLRDFEGHANVYDDGYTNALTAALCST